MPDRLAVLLREKNLQDAFNTLTYHRRKDILRYLNNIKTPHTLEKNINKIVLQLEGKTPGGDVPISLSIGPRL